MTISDNLLTDIIILRGLGYTQQEIANKLNISRKTVENKLHILNDESINNGVYSTYLKYINIKQCMREELKEEFKHGK